MCIVQVPVCAREIESLVSIIDRLLPISTDDATEGASMASTWKFVLVNVLIDITLNKGESGDAAFYNFFGNLIYEYCLITSIKNFENFE